MMIAKITQMTRPNTPAMTPTAVQTVSSVLAPTDRQYTSTLSQQTRPNVLITSRPMCCSCTNYIFFFCLSVYLTLLCET